MLVLALAFGCGLYALAPGGQYVNSAGEWLDYGMQGVSHDWRQFLWFTQVPWAWPTLLVLGLLLGIFSAVVLIIPTAVVAVTLTRFLPSLGAKFMRIRVGILLSGAALMGFLGGITWTIINGRTPGIP
jgi:hypothetical protein